VGSEAFSHTKTPDLFQAMIQGIPFVSPLDNSGNQFQANLDYRGFTASPVQGTPQGIAVYQNGVRINEAWGDVVNWNFIPEMAINRMTLMPNNPVFGLNAIGGALSIDMKNGFTYHGEEVELRGGSFGRVGGGAQAGIQNGNYSAYVAAESVRDDGWRDFSSSSQLNRIYADMGARGGDQTEFHLQFTGSDDRLGAVAATPICSISAGHPSFRIRRTRIFSSPSSKQRPIGTRPTRSRWRASATIAVSGKATSTVITPVGSRVILADLFRASCVSATA
jgi:iron complex outermembrane recepter protein